MEYKVRETSVSLSFFKGTGIKGLVVDDQKKLKNNLTCF